MNAARRITAKTKIFQLKIQLAHIRPPIWRRLLVPGELDNPPADWKQTRNKWEFFQGLRSWLLLLGFILICLGTTLT